MSYVYHIYSTFVFVSYTTTETIQQNLSSSTQQHGFNKLSKFLHKKQCFHGQLLYCKAQS